MEILSLGGNSLSGPVPPNGAWDDQTPLSAWQGVTVTAGRVTAVDLSGLGLAGPPAPQLGALDALERLDASANALTGPIPAELASLAALEVLDLSSNALTGAVPPQLGSLAGLEVLDLSLNTLNGPIPSQLGNLASVEVLDLAGNDLTGAIPVELGSLTGLRVLRITGPGLTGPIPTQLGALSGLTELLIDGGQLSGPIPVELAALTSLESLHIAGGQLSGTIPAQLADLSTLDSLYISAPNLTGTLPPELADLAGLQTLWIKSQSLTGTIPARYASLTGLRTLYLSGGGLTGPVPVWITSLSGIERLYLHNNSLDGPVPANLAQLNALSTLWLAGNTLTGTIPPQLADIAALQTLDLRDNPLTWPPPAALADPRQGLTAILPDATWWAPPRPEDPAAQPGDTELTIAWQHPGAGSDYHIDHYSINYRPQNHTGAFAQTTADASPATISGLTNGTTYDIFVTATNTRGTSAPSVTVAAAPLMSAAQTAGFNDVHPSNVHAGDIARLEGWGIFDGTNCGPDMFCPDDPLQRIRLAVWLVRALDRGRHVSAPPVAFTDVSATHPWKHYVDRLYQLNVTRGCSATPLKFCPNDPVDRAQMAVFLQRAFTIPNANPAGFTDVPTTHYAYNAINAIYAANITLGCSATPLKYCPNNPTTHAQMATFISRACNYAGPCDPIDPIVVDPIIVTPTGPLAPTITKITPGPGTLTITWEPDTSSPPGTRPAATSWKIHYRRFIETTNPQGALTTQYFTPAEPVPVPGPAIPSATHILQGLEFDAHYAIKIQGLAGTTPGSFSPETKTKTDPAAVRLVALEITQGLQNWNGDITLVKGKRTVVRAFLEPLDGKPTKVNVRLQAVRGGETFEASGLFNSDSDEIVRPGNSNENDYTAMSGAAGNRDLLGSSANFVLNGPDWIGDYLDETEDDPYVIEYEIKVDEGVVCRASLQSDNPCKATVSFKRIPVPVVDFVPVATSNGTPSATEVEEQRLRIATMMPIPDLAYAGGLPHAVFESYASSVPSAGLVTDVLQLRFAGDSNMVHLGIMQGFEDRRHPVGSFDGRFASWFIGEAVGILDGGFYRNTGPHEFGHILHERHTAFEDVDGRFYQVCTLTPVVHGGSQIAAGLKPPVQYEYIMSVVGEFGRIHQFALLGDEDDIQEQYWGLDTRLIYYPTSSLTVVDPREVYSLMSYCAGNEDSQYIWMDGFHMPRFLTTLETFDWGSVGSSSANVRDLLVVSGTRTENADGSVSIVVAPLFVNRSAMSVVQSTVGDHAVQLLDSSNEVLMSVRFGVDPVAESEPIAGLGTARSSYWQVVIPDPPDFVGYRIVEGSSVVAEGRRSMSAPAVTVNPPVTGQDSRSTEPGSGDDMVRLSWAASDADGEELTYRVQYSSDGGTSYATVAHGLRVNTLELARSRLPGSTRARFRVIASDGIRSASAESPLFTVAPQAPKVYVHGPTEATVYGRGAVVVLHASSHDIEDGSLPDTSITWSSDIDGHLSDNGFALVATDQLTSGVHRLTATATDRSSMTASASVTIEVRDSNDAPDSRGDYSYVRTGTDMIVDVLGNDADTEGDLLPHTLHIAVPPSSGTASTVAHSDRGRAIIIAPDTVGYDVLVYEVCDQAQQCSQAEVVVIAESS